MTEQETKQRKNRKRRKRKRATTNVQNVLNIQENSDIEGSTTKKVRLDSQATQLELTSNSDHTRVSEMNGQSFHLNILFDTQTVSDRAETTTVTSTLYTNGDKKNPSIKKYMITEKDLIRLARIKENEQHVDDIDGNNGRPVITFSISDDNLIHLELIQGKENDKIIKNFVEKEQIDNFKGNGQTENLRIESSVNETPENFKEIEYISNSIQIGNTENSDVNGEIENQIGFIKNSKEHDQVEIFLQNDYIENSNEHEQIEGPINNEDFEHLGISKKDNNLFKQFLRHTNSKHLPPGLIKYWHQRYLLFSLYDKGIMMDEEGWYSVTPEYLAEYLAKRCACDTIIDAMCGVGGNAIQFAKTCKKVIAIDIDQTKLFCAKNNASVYGVEDKIEFILGDFYDLVPHLKADVVFLSPPWGGPSYLKSKVYDIKTMITVDGERLFRESSKITKNIVYYLPRSINIDQMKMLCDPDKICEFQKVIVWDKTRSYVVYYGDLVGNYSSEEIEVSRYWADDTSADYIQSEESENKGKKRMRKK